MDEVITVTPIGWVTEGRNHTRDDYWGGVVSVIEMDRARFEPEALAGLEDYSHLEVVFFMNRVPEDKLFFGLRRPRNNPDWPQVGIFAQRAPKRPNRLGVTTCNLLKVEGLGLRVEGLDAIVGTPVLDIKPAIKEFGPRGRLIQPKWMTELMADYWAPESERPKGY